MTVNKASATLFFGLLLVLSCSLQASDSRPNIILYLADDLGYGDLSSFGAENIKTPEIDKLAEEGVSFTSFYAQPICGPSRAALLTGAYPLRVAEPDNKKHPNTIPHAKERLLPEVLQAAGYRTGIIGKWHLAGEGEEPWEFAPPPLPPPPKPGGKGPFKSDLMPNARGFEYFYGTPMHNGISQEVDNRRFIIELMRNGEVIETPADNNLLTARYTEEAITFLEKKDDRPFFLFMSYNAPHTPLGVHPDFRDRSKRGLYGDAVEELDWSIAQINRTLSDLDLVEDTIVIFLSDNGPETRDELGEDIGSAGRYRGGKYSNWEGGVRVPAIWRWPGQIAADKQTDALVSIMDLYPTLIAVAEGELPDRKIDGHDVLPLLREPENAQTPYDAYYYYMLGQLQAVRSGDWKLVFPRQADSPYLLWLGRYMDEVPRPALYNLADDPAEAQDIAASHPAVVERLYRLAEKARKDIGDVDTLGTGARFFDSGDKRPNSYFPDAARSR